MSMLLLVVDMSYSDQFLNGLHVFQHYLGVKRNTFENSHKSLNPNCTFHQNIISYKFLGVSNFYWVYLPFIFSLVCLTFWSLLGFSSSLRLCYVHHRRPREVVRNSKTKLRRVRKESSG